MPSCDNAVIPSFIDESEKYLIVAQLLRERAKRPELPPEQVAKATSLAEYFEALADDPSARIKC